MPALRLLALSALILACATVPARAQQTLNFGRVTTLPVTVDTILPTVVAGGSLTVLLPLEANLQLPDEPLAEVHTLAFHGQIDGLRAPSTLRFTQHLRGWVDKTAESRVVFTVNFGSTTKTEVFPYGQVHSGPVFVSVPSVSRWTPGQPYVGTVTLVVERRNTAAKVIASAGSLDATVRR
jgi:hypothetical protein